MDWTDHSAVYDSVRDPDLALDMRVFRQDQGARLVISSNDVAAHTTVDPQASTERNAAFDRRAGADQAIDSILRFIGFVVSEHGHTPCHDALTAWVSLGSLLPFSNTRTCTLFTTVPGST